MAKFGERFLASVANPTYGRGLFSAGAAFGAAPRLRREREEKERREKGMMGGMLAAQQAASEGRFDPETMRSYIGSLRGLGVPTEDIMKTLPDLQKTQQSSVFQNTLIKDFNQWAITNNINPEIVKDIERGIKGKQITTVQGAIDLATQNEQKAFQKEYFADLSTYDPFIGALVKRGAFEAAETRFQTLQQQQKEKPSREFLVSFQKKGGEVTDANRGDVWNAVVGTSKDMNEATTIMKRLETQSIEKRAAKHKGPTKKITYIPKAQTQAEAISYSIGVDTSRVPTKQIDAPIDLTTGEVDAQWMTDFKKHSAEKIIGMGENAPKSTETSEDSNTPENKKTKDTPRSLAERSMGLQDTETTVLGPVGFTQ